jgi:thiamine biosynthesis lipoprotein
MCYPQSNLSKEDSEKLINNTIVLVQEFENYFTVFRDSPFNKVNEFAGIKAVKVSKEAIDIVKKSLEYFKITKSYFNILYESKKGFNDLSKIIINDKDNTLFLPYKEMKISLGGIGKGAAVDMAFQYLKSNGLINFMINGSGDLRVHSHPNAPRPWKVGIQNPFNIKNNIGNIQLKNESIATSGQYLKKNHIKHESKNTPLSVTVVGKSVTECDVWATYLSTLEVKESINVANKNNIFSILISESGKVFHTRKSLQSLQRANL